MGFEEEREDRWPGGREPSFSKGTFLRKTAECGAMQTGITKDGEWPYDGAIAHAERLAFEGLVEKMIIEPFHGGEPFTCWTITPLGKITAGVVP